MLLLCFQNVYMAYSKSSSIKSIKAVGTLQWSQTSWSYDKIDSDDVKLLSGLVKQLHKNLANVKTDSVEGKTRIKKKDETNDVREVIRGIVAKMLIESALSNYESSDEYDD